MMKTILIGIAFSMLFLVYLFCRVPVIKADMINSDGFTIAHKPYIVFPSNHITYDSKSLTLNVSFRAEVWGNVKYTMVYSLDGQKNESLPLLDHYYSWVQGEHDKSYVDGSIILPELPDGSHTITVYLECDWAIGYATGWEHHYYYDNQTVYFIVKNTASPTSTPSPIPQQPTAEPTQSASPTSFAPDFSLIIVCIAVIGTVAAVILVHFRKKYR